MNGNYGRLVFYVSALAILLILDTFTDFDHEILFAIAIILAFLILSTYIFKSGGSKLLKSMLIVFTFIGLPLFILWYLGILNYFSNPLGGIVIALITTVLGVLAIFAIIKLDYVEIEYVEE